MSATTTTRRHAPETGSETASDTLTDRGPAASAAASAGTGTATAPDLAGRDRQGRFRPGQSGNPAGKKPGTRSLATRLREHMEPDDERRVMRTIIEAAIKGNVPAAILMMRQLYPTAPGREIILDVPEDADAATLFGEVKAQMIRGEITPVEADRILTVEGRGNRMVAAQAAMARKAAETLQSACNAADRVRDALRAAGSGPRSGPASPARPGTGPLPLHRTAAPSRPTSPVPTVPTVPATPDPATATATPLQTACKQAA